MTDFEQLAIADETHRAYVRIPEGARAGVVVLHAWWGLNEDVLRYSDRLANAGYAVLAPDMFRGQVATEIADAERLSSEGDAGGADKIAFGAIDELAARLGPDAPLATLGWSFGAAYAIWAPSERDRVTATVLYYGAWTDKFITRAATPVLGHFAEDDPYTTEDEVQELETALREAGREATMHRYPGTGHWFAEPSREAYRPEAAELAFVRSVAFLREKLGPGA